MALAAGTEGGARDQGDVLGLEEFFSELVGGVARARDVGEDVEGALRLEARQAHLREAVVDQVAAAVVLSDHLLHVLLAVAQRLDGRNLGRDRRAEHRVLVDLRHGADEGLVAERIADAPARHRVGLREAVEENRALLHAGQGGEADVLLAAVRQVAVDLVGDDDEVVLLGKGRDGQEILARHDGACRVVRIADEQRLRPGGHVLFELVRRDAELVLNLGRHGDGLAARENRAGLVGDVARLRDQDLVARREDGAHDEVERLADTDCHEDVGVGIIRAAVLVGVVAGNLLAQLGQAAVCRIRGVSLLEAVDAALADGPGRDEVWLADAE